MTGTGEVDKRTTICKLTHIKVAMPDPEVTASRLPGTPSVLPLERGFQWRFAINIAISCALCAFVYSSNLPLSRWFFSIPLFVCLARFAPTLARTAAKGVRFAREVHLFSTAARGRRRCRLNCSIAESAKEKVPDPRHQFLKQQSAVGSIFRRKAPKTGNSINLAEGPTQ